MRASTSIGALVPKSPRDVLVEIAVDRIAIDTTRRLELRTLAQDDAGHGIEHRAAARLFRHAVLDDPAGVDHQADADLAAIILAKCLRRIIFTFEQSPQRDGGRGQDLDPPDLVVAYQPVIFKVEEAFRKLGLNCAELDQAEILDDHLASLKADPLRAVE